MCGIAGILRLDATAARPSIEELRAMLGALSHRGPDEFGVYRDDAAGLAHARLSIIDLATGQQPLSSEDAQLWTVFNGEIYNYLELRRELCELGHHFRTESDTEVIVHAYESWGDEAFARFNGQWAIALWDARRKRLVLARDPVGVRPLYLCQHRGRLYFASEVKAIFAADRSVRRAFDPIGLDQCFTFWAPVAPRTVFEGISELEPGHVQRYAGGAVTKHAAHVQRYPRTASEQFQGSLEDATVAVRSSLDQATRLRALRADVPVGSYLSGGLDSSLIAALAMRARGRKLATFSLRFEDVEYDETEHQRLMSTALDAEHHELLVTRRDIAQSFPLVVYHAERPLLRTAPAPMFLLSRLVRECGIKVVLTGEGADEVFAGYDLFREAKLRRFWARHPESELRPRLLARLYPYLARSPVSLPAVARRFFGRNLAAWREPGFSHEPRWFSTQQALRRLLSRTMQSSLETSDVVSQLLASLPMEFSRWSWLAQDQYLEISTLLCGYLLSAQGDRMLMAHSVEGRFPFLDPNVMGLAATLPPAYKLRVLDEKHVLKAASRGLLPEAILKRKKQPFRAPDAAAFALPGPHGSSLAWLAEVTTEQALSAAGVFDPAAVRQLWRKCSARYGWQLSNSDNMALVAVLSTQLLHERLIRSVPATRAVPLGTIIDRQGERRNAHPPRA